MLYWAINRKIRLKEAACSSIGKFFLFKEFRGTVKTKVACLRNVVMDIQSFWKWSHLLVKFQRFHINVLWDNHLLDICRLTKSKPDAQETEGGQSAEIAVIAGPTDKFSYKLKQKFKLLNDYQIIAFEDYEKLKGKYGKFSTILVKKCDARMKIKAKYKTMD